MNIQKCMSAKVCNRCDLEIELGSLYRATSYKALHVECWELEEKEKAERENFKHLTQPDSSNLEKVEIDNKEDTLEVVTLAQSAKEVYSYIDSQRCCKCGEQAIGIVFQKSVCVEHIADIVRETV